MTSHLSLNEGWEFRRLGETSDTPWSPVELPHTPFVADLNGAHHWLGECEYRRRIQYSPTPGQRCALFIGAAMHTARVFIDGREVALHRGGYLPFEVDLTAALQPHGACDIRLRLDNRDNPDVPPGKPLDELDFCWFGGLYRGAELRIRPALHITDAVAAGQTAGGGVFIRTLNASPDRATLAIKTHVLNTADAPAAFHVRLELHFGPTLVASRISELLHAPANAALHVEQEIVVEHPRLWSPGDPALHHAVISILSSDNGVVDERTERIGIRRLAFSRSRGFEINGRRLRLRGTNRHQEMPRVGYAVPRAAHHRDARRIKDAGFDYVRLSHYPQSPDFLDACDELGIVVMNCIPGWQFLGGEAFRQACFQAARDLIRRDRNHPCVVLWELSLNETAMDEPFMAGLHRIGHEEFPGGQMFTCGWIDAYDVFNHSRQHGSIHTWRNGDKALVIAEYGDWEFYASNDGFDQKTGAGIFDRWSTARQFRADGERGLRQQALNHLVALNDTLSSPAVLDGQWAMFDYARGYDPVRAPVGVMDVFRVPKFSYHFYRSQRDATDPAGGPMVFIASYWTPTSDLRIRVFSNCDEVELRLNGRLLARQPPARSAFTQRLPHPPFVFDIPEFRPGTLEATGLVRGQPQAVHAVTTPGSPARLQLRVDDLGIAPAAHESDVLIVHATTVDTNDTVCIDESTGIAFNIEGAEIVGPAIVASEAGIASLVVRLPASSPGFAIDAHVASSSARRAPTLCWSRHPTPATTDAIPELPVISKSFAP